MWHPKFEKGKRYAEQIHANFGREIQSDTIYRRPGIPVFYKNEIKNKIDLNNAIHTVVFALVEDEMVVDPEWNSFLEELWKQIENTDENKHRIYPVSLSENAFNIEYINHINFIRLHDIPEENYIKKFVGSATHEISRLLLNQPRISKEDGLSTSPVSLFLSHAKKDGEKLAKSIKKYIYDQTSLKTFFDANDIAAGHSFSSEINQSIELSETALLIIHTDTYSSRDWCRREVIQAKLSNIPIVVINIVSIGESRSFPYMGNVPTIRWDGSEEVIADIIDNTLMEILRHLYTKKHLESLTDIYEVSDRVHTISHHPELMSFVNILKDEGDKDILTVLYPDPPIGYEELQLLHSIKPKFRFLTPTMLPILRYAEEAEYEEPLDILHDLKIGLSISDSPDLLDYGMSGTHLEDALVEFSRYLLVHGGRILYGGDLREGGFTEKLYNLVRSYFPEETQSSHKIFNYQAWPIYLKLTTEIRAELNKIVNFKTVEPPQVSGLDENTFLKPDSTENRVIWAKSLTKMREEMNENLNVRIIIGGVIKNYKGKYPGLLEEAYMALREEKPLFLLGGFGGCTKAIINVLQGEKTFELTEEFQKQDKDYLDMVNEYNSDPAVDDTIDYDTLLKFFKEKGIESLNNGLSIDENLILFNTFHVPEMISLVLKGLANIAKK
ncbi:TIR domain-containing protein [Salisediminibacterium beveridgei]|nr:TIR domain-containing protein [Salisediminibacterium beveridgei]